MKGIYPIIIEKENENLYTARVPDFNIQTEDNSLSGAIEMAKDATSLLALDMEEDKEEIPKPSDYDSLEAENSNQKIALIDIDTKEYSKRVNDANKLTVKKSVTIPKYLAQMAKIEKLNVSKILTEALKDRLEN